jgi:hypothetical protein
MEKQRTFNTIDDYLLELNNEAFKAGVDASLRYTKKTGYETGFNVFYDPSFGIFYTEIFVGGKKGLSIKDEVAESLFGKKSGLTISELRQLVDYMEKENIKDSLDFPHKESLTLDDYLYSDEKDIGPNNWEVVSFHTHPYSKECLNNTRPSCLDLESLHSSRIISEYNTIIVISGLTEDDEAKEIPSIVVQEKADVKFEGNFGFEAAIGFEADSNPACLEELVPSLRKRVNESILFVRENYEILKGHYTIGEGFSF